ncbi:hypothetical protein HY633_02610 [Candidatus Uhrbacteria bacterium]|nr:hypothetical protein [Candidatus Uhrbacteria bacterium]
MKPGLTSPDTSARLRPKEVRFGLGLVIAFTSGDDKVAKKVLEQPGPSLSSWILIIMSVAGWLVLAVMGFIRLAKWVAAVYPT